MIDWAKLSNEEIAALDYALEQYVNDEVSCSAEVARTLASSSWLLLRLLRSRLPV